MSQLLGFSIFRSSKTLVIVFLFIRFALSQYENQLVGPYVMILNMVEPCQDVGSGDLMFSLRRRRISRSIAVYESNMTLKNPFDDNLMLSINLGQFTNGGIKKNFYRQDFPKACSSLARFFPKAFKGLFKGARTSSNPKICSVPPGQYISHNFTIDENMAQIPVFFYNKYKSKITYFRDGKRVACHYYYTNIVPKRIPRKH